MPLDPSLRPAPTAPPSTKGAGHARAAAGAARRRRSACAGACARSAGPAGPRRRAASRSRQDHREAGVEAQPGAAGDDARHAPHRERVERGRRSGAPRPRRAAPPRGRPGRSTRVGRRARVAGAVRAGPARDRGERDGERQEARHGDEAERPGHRPIVAHRDRAY